MIRHARVKRNTVLYMDYGALEFADHPHSRSLFAEVSALLIEKRVLLNSRISFPEFPNKLLEIL